MRSRRLRAALVDEAIVAGIAVLLYGMALQTGVVALLALPVSRLAAPLATAAGGALVPLTAALVVVLLWVTVRLPFRVLGTGSPSGQTPGKRITGLRVVDAGDGRPPGYRAALIREAVLLAEVLTVVGLVGALARHPWHDAVAGTRVTTVPHGPDGVTRA